LTECSGEPGPRHNKQVEKGGGGNRGEIREHIIRQRFEQRRRDRRVVAGHQQRVAVAGSGRGSLRGDNAASAGSVFDDELLSKPSREFVSEHAHRDVGYRRRRRRGRSG